MSDQIPVLSQALAHRIWSAHREIDVGRKLLDKLRDDLARGEDPNPLDAFGRRRPYQLGVPNGSGHMLYDIDPKLAVYIIEGHIAAKQKELADAVLARMELDGIGTEAGRATSGATWPQDDIVEHR